MSRCGVFSFNRVKNIEGRINALSAEIRELSSEFVYTKTAQLLINYAINDKIEQIGRLEDEKARLIEGVR